MTTRYVSHTKHQTFKFLDNMYRDRGYDLETKRTCFYGDQKSWQIFIKDPQGQTVLTILTRQQTTQSQTSGFDEHVNDKMEGAFFIHDKKTEKINNSFIKDIEKYALENQIQTIILIGENLNHYAVKEIKKSPIDISFFSYGETSSARFLATHVAQRQVQLLTPAEIANFQQTYPHHEQEVVGLPLHDTLIRYYGFPLGALIRVTENNCYTGTTEEIYRVL